MTRVADPPSQPPAAGAPGARGDAFAIATFEFQNFGAIRELLGPTGVRSLLLQAAGRVTAIVRACEVIAIERASLSVRFPMQGDAAVEAALLATGGALGETMREGGIPFRLVAHIGWAAPAPGVGAAVQAERAAMAAWSAKIGGQRLRAYDAQAGGSAQVPDAQLLRDLPAAMVRGETRLEYQPKVDARSGRPQALEALLRWSRGDGRPAPIGHLIGLTEHTGFIRDLTEWAIARALDDAARLAAAGHTLPIHVNVSAPLLGDDDFLNDTLTLLNAPGSAGISAIGFELTETAAIADKAQVRRNLMRLTEAGVHVAIDDYGSGLSSLAYLKGLPVRELKIDRLFISELTRCNRDPLIVRSTIDLAHAMELQVTAEGVEDPVSAALLGVMGCDLLQGFQICPPLGVDALIEFLSEETVKPAEPASLLRRLNAG